MMPEIPDLTMYLEHLQARFAGQILGRLRLFNPFVLRSTEPRPGDFSGRTVLGFSRSGKRIIWKMDGDRFIVVHLMIAGRFHLHPAGTKPRVKNDLASFDFDAQSVFLTEASSKKRASIHLVAGRDGLEAFARTGVEPLEVSLTEFATAIRRENHTIKRAMTDPDILSGIGNAYSDEILHAARLSPLTLTQKLTDEQIGRLFVATQKTLRDRIARLRAQLGAEFPEKVTAFRDDMAVHGRFKRACPDCGAPIQRIAYAENECNYCARCQTGGHLLADRSLSRLMKDDWPKTIDELEKIKLEFAARAQAQSPKTGA